MKTIPCLMRLSTAVVDIGRVARAGLGAVCLLALVGGCVASGRINAADLDVRKPNLDSEGRFWVFRDSAPGSPLPFIPYGGMPEGVDKIMIVNTAWKGNTQGSGSSSNDTCIAVDVKWGPPYWCGLAFISGSDNPQWWGEDSTGSYYDLGTLNRKVLVFWARGEVGGERIQAKVGILGDKKFGDSLKFPVQTRWLKLTKDWSRFEVDLSKYNAEQLGRICNGFTFVVNRDQQDGSKEKTRFFLDTIYFE